MITPEKRSVECANSEEEKDDDGGEEEEVKEAESGGELALKNEIEWTV